MYPKLKPFANVYDAARLLYLSVDLLPLLIQILTYESLKLLPIHPHLSLQQPNLVYAFHLCLEQATIEVLNEFIEVFNFHLFLYFGCDLSKDVGCIGQDTGDKPCLVNSFTDSIKWYCQSDIY